MAEMALVGRIDDLPGVVQHNTFNGGGTNVQTNSHRILPPADGVKLRDMCAGSAPRRYNIKLYYTGFCTIRQEYGAGKHVVKCRNLS